MKPFNHISVLFSEPLEASLRFLMPEVLNARYRLYGFHLSLLKDFDVADDPLTYDGR